MEKKVSYNFFGIIALFCHYQNNCSIVWLDIKKGVAKVQQIYECSDFELVNPDWGIQCPDY